MAKVTGPLMSISASGKLANALVFFGWKGTACVRNFVIPTNKESVGQGLNRVVLGGTGRACAEIYPASGHVTVSAFAQRLITLGLIPGGQTKQSYLVKYIIDHYISTLANYTAQLAAVVGHTSYTAFQSAADALGIIEFTLPYNTAGAYNKALGVYLIAKFATDIPLTGTPYSLALASWVTASINSMICDFTKA